MKLRFTAAVLGLVAAANAHAVSVIVAASSPLPEIDADQVRQIFLGRQFTLNGQTLSIVYQGAAVCKKRCGNLNGEPISVVYQGEGPTRTDFETKVLGKSGAELTEYWSKLIFTGKANPPIEGGGDDGVKAIVGRTQGAIGYISDSAVDKTVKVLYKF